MARHASLEEMRKIVTLDKALTAFDARLVLALTYHRSSRNHACFPTEAILAEELGVSDTHVRSRMKKAIALGYVGKRKTQSGTDFWFPWLGDVGPWQRDAASATPLQTASIRNHTSGSNRKDSFGSIPNISRECIRNHSFGSYNSERARGYLLNGFSHNDTVPQWPFEGIAETTYPTVSAGSPLISCAAGTQRWIVAAERAGTSPDAKDHPQHSDLHNEA